MPVNYGAAGLSPMTRALIDISDNMRAETQMSMFDSRKADFGALALMDVQTNSPAALISPAEAALIGNAIEATGIQPAQLQNIYGDRPLNTDTQLNPFGTGSSGVGVVNPTFFDGVAEHFDTSRTLNAIRQKFGTISPNLPSNQATSDAEMIEFQKQFFKLLRNIYDRINTQMLNYLTTNQWAVTSTADDGTVYAINGVADFKEIPIAEAQLTGNSAPRFLSGLDTEMMQNAFTKSGRPVILASANTHRYLANYQSYGQGNIANVVNHLDRFDVYTETRLDETGSKGRLLALNAHSVAMYQQKPFPYGAPVAANDGIEYLEPIAVGRGTPILPDMPPLVLDHMRRVARVDNSATYGQGMGTNDITTVHTFRVRVGALRAYTTNTDVSPIIDYRFV